MNKDNGWHHAKVPFFLEVEYYDEVNPEAEDAIMKSLFRNEDILPGLRVNKMFANCVDKDILVSDEIQNDLNCAGVSSAFAIFTLGFSHFGTKHCLDSKAHHESQLRNEEERIRNLNNKKCRKEVELQMTEERKKEKESDLRYLNYS